MTWTVSIAIWFAASALLQVLGTVILWGFLAYHGVEVPTVRIGVPFYLERLYREWAEGAGHSPKVILNIRAVSTFNAILASVAFIVAVTALHSHGK